MLSPKLKAEIRSLWDAFWAGGIANPLTAIEQITYLVFLKQLEDLDKKREAETRNTDRRSIFDVENGETYRWSYIKGLEKTERLAHVRDVVFEWLKTIEEGDNKDRMRDAVFVIRNPNLLDKAVETIDTLYLTQQNQDIVGDIYEMLLSEIAEAGKNGQFRTPRHIIRAMCYLVDPKPGERIGDPACGTAGFLINSYQHILAEYTDRDKLEFTADGSPLNTDGRKLDPDILNSLRRNHFYGFDFDRTMVRLGWMNMIQHGLENPQIFYADTLGNRFYEEYLYPTADRTSPSSKELLASSFDVVLANPPFAGNIDKNNVGKSLRIGTNKTELLFLELILQLLKPGTGRAAVIVPEGVLFGSTTAHKEIRRKLVEENRLTAVVSLPGGVFQPYTGVKASILVFYKGGSTENIWFYEVGADGFTLDAKRTPRPEENDLWDMVVQYRLREAQLIPQNQISAPAFVSGELWSEWREKFDADTLKETYFAPLYVEDRRREDTGQSVFTEPELLYQTITEARKKVIDAAKTEYSNAPKEIEQQTLVQLQRQLSRLYRDYKGKNEWPAILQEERDNLIQEALMQASSLENVPKAIRGRFERAAEKAGVQTHGEETHGLNELRYALAKALEIPLDVEAIVKDILILAEEYLDRNITIAKSSEKSPLLIVQIPSAKDVRAAEDKVAEDKVQLVRPFAQLDGYNVLMFGRMKAPLTPLLRKEIRPKVKHPKTQWPELPRWWTATNLEMNESSYNLIAGRYKPFRVKLEDFDNPTEIINSLQNLEAQIQEGLNKLSLMIKGEA
jgi:type I restriction enzyme M protein